MTRVSEGDASDFSLDAMNSDIEAVVGQGE
jgi:hypothetical protein